MFLSDISDLESASEAYQKLEELTCSYGLLNVVRVFKDMCKIELKEHEGMYSYINQLQSMERKIRKAGFLLPDNIIATFVLAGLPLPKHDNFVRSLEDDGQITMAAVKSKLLMEEKRSKPASKKMPYEEGDEVSAMKVTSRRPVQGNNGKMASQSQKPFFKHKRYVICFACGEKGHIQANCPRFEAEREGERRNQEKI